MGMTKPKPEIYEKYKNYWKELDQSLEAKASY